MSYSPTIVQEITAREQEILRQLSQGLTSRQIASNLSLSAETIKWYRKRMLAKFNADNTAQMVRQALESGII
ncbi:MAG: helix-turn-helix transcriptional regulator [Bacteroidales bacterium]|nr:helix-turn-helix transcriptional regulator [Bacteroidales bacterium]